MNHSSIDTYNLILWKQFFFKSTGWKRGCFVKDKCPVSTIVKPVVWDTGPLPRDDEIKNRIKTPTDYNTIDDVRERNN
jgi:hypothetical protein